jgi:TolB-like protein/Tfp pilus assembly protein PilF
VKIVDFGLAKLAGKSKLTKETTTLGTVAYMSPEQTEGSSVDHRTDIWSLGVVLYEMITGQLPFKGEYENAVIYSIINEEPRQLTAMRSGISMELERIVNKCLEKNPSNRYQHVDDLIVDLQRSKEDSESKITTSRKDVLLKESIGGKKPILLPLILLSVAIIVVLGYFLINQFIVKEKSESESIGTLQWENSIAVLPFVDLSPEKDQEYFCDGMTEQIITNLSKLGKLKVIGRTSVMSYKNTDKKLPDIGKELKISHILEGSIRKYGNSIRVTAQLINTEDGSHLWADDYDRELKNIFTIQDDISEKIAQVMLQKLSIEEIGEVKSKRPSNTEAYELYLRGRHLRIQQTDESLQRALEYFKQAIAKDSTFALAYAGLAKIYRLNRSTTVDAKSKMKKAIKKALELDDTLSEAYIGLGDILEFEFDWAGAENAYKKAIELNPGNSEAHYEFGWLLLRTGRLEEGLMEMKQSLELDPLSLLAHHGAAFAYYYNREYDKSINYNLMALELDENYRMAYIGLVIAYTAKNEFDRALDALDKMSGDTFFAGVLYAKMGKREEALKYVQKVSDSVKGLIYSAFGEKDEAFFWIDKAIVEKEPLLWMLKIDPNFDNLRSDPRYNEFLRKIGLEP